MPDPRKSRPSLNFIEAYRIRFCGKIRSSSDGFSGETTRWSNKVWLARAGRFRAHDYDGEGVLCQTRPIGASAIKCCYAVLEC